MPLIITILLMGILSGAEVDIFVPSFPDLQRTFHLSPFMVELTLGINLVAHCVTALLVGNMGDRYGRRPVIIYGLSIFIFGSIVCVCATAFWQLLMGRLLQGIGISGPAVLSFVVLADRYSAEKQQQMLGALNGIMTLAMAFAPVFGSFVNLYFSWRGNFVALLVLSLICMVTSLVWLPAGQANPDISLSLKEYKVVLQSRPAFYYIATIVLVLQGYWVFIGMSPIFYMESLGVSLKHFGLYQGALAALFSLCSFGSCIFIKRFGQKKCLFASLYVLALFMVALLTATLFNVKNPLLITAIMGIQSVGILMPMNILWPLMLEAIPSAKGKISALCISSRLLVTALSIQIASYFYNGTLRSLGSTMLIFMGLAFWAGCRLFQVTSVFPQKKEVTVQA